MQVLQRIKTPNHDLSVGDTLDGFQISRIDYIQDRKEIKIYANIDNINREICTIVSGEFELHYIHVGR